MADAIPAGNKDQPAGDTRAVAALLVGNHSHIVQGAAGHQDAFQSQDITALANRCLDAFVQRLRRRQFRNRLEGYAHSEITRHLL